MAANSTAKLYCAFCPATLSALASPLVFQAAYLHLQRAVTISTRGELASACSITGPLLDSPTPAHGPPAALGPLHEASMDVTLPQGQDGGAPQALEELPTDPTGRFTPVGGIGAHLHARRGKGKSMLVGAALAQERCRTARRQATAPRTHAPPAAMLPGQRPVWVGSADARRAQRRAGGGQVPATRATGGSKRRGATSVGWGGAWRRLLQLLMLQLLPGKDGSG